MIVLTPASGSPLQLSAEVDVYSWSFGVQSQTVNAGISLTTTLADAHVSNMKSALLGGNLAYDTIVPLQAADGQDPESGEILISGNGTVHIVIESSTLVRIDIDSDGDGIVEDIQYTTWAALQG